MNITSKVLLATCGTLGAAVMMQGSAQAATLTTYDLTGSNATQSSFTVNGSNGGPTLTVSALPSDQFVGRNGSGMGVGPNANETIELNETLRLFFSQMVRVVSVTFSTLDNAQTGDAYSLSIDGNFLSSGTLFNPPISTVNLATLITDLDDRSGYFFDFSALDLDDDYKVSSIAVEYGSDVVPTPALLPGLIGLGFGVLRRRKNPAEADQASS